MKPLQMLDFLALWYARVFTAFLLIEGILWSDQAISLMGIFVFLWAASCWFYKWDIVRLYLALSPVAVIPIITYLQWQDAPPTTLLTWLLVVWLNGSFATMSWIGFRSLAGSNFSFPFGQRRRLETPANNPSTFPLLFRESVPSV